MATNGIRKPFPAITAARGLWLALLTIWILSAPAQARWNEEWSIRKKITVNTGASGVPMTEPLGSAVILVRLHEGNFDFNSAKEDASDLRFIAADDKTPLPFHIEKFESDMKEGFVWVKVSDIKPGGETSFWLYYGNAGEVTRADDAKATYDADTVLVYHFAESNVAAVDSTSNANNAQQKGRAAEGTVIGSGMRSDGKAAVKLPEAASLNWKEGSALTWSLWIKPATLQANAVVFSRRSDDSAFVVGLDNGIPFVEVKTAAGTQRSAPGAALVVDAWRHLAVVASATEMTLLLDGEPYATLKAGLPALSAAALLGGDSLADAVGFAGEADELEISKVARPLGVLKLAALNQGTGEKAAKLLAVGNDEQSGHGGESEIAKHLTLIADISKSLTFDGWVVIGLCTLLAVVGWVVTWMKFVYLGKITKATNVFLKEWENLGTDLSLLDHSDKQSIKSMGGKVNSKTQKLMGESPLYHIYMIGCSEIAHRIANAGSTFSGLSGRSMQAIRATLDGGLVREVQRANSNLVFLTIGIAGGPYLGLLGTVIGVMITFAVIAKSGAVEVNSIAPGIAGALLATVAGLAVAIPALFAYSYISSRIKDAVGEMQIFIDEFIAKIAESFPSQND